MREIYYYLPIIIGGIIAITTEILGMYINNADMILISLSLPLGLGISLFLIAIDKEDSGQH